MTSASLCQGAPGGPAAMLSPAEAGAGDPSSYLGKRRAGNPLTGHGHSPSLCPTGPNPPSAFWKDLCPPASLAPSAAGPGADALPSGPSHLMQGGVGRSHLAGRVCGLLGCSFRRSPVGAPAACSGPVRVQGPRQGPPVPGFVLENGSFSYWYQAWACLLHPGAPEARGSAAWFPIL